MGMEDKTLSASIQINRPAYDLHNFNKTYKLTARKSGGKANLKSWLKEKVSCSKECALTTLFHFFPFISIMKDYKWKSWIFGDIVAGLSIGVIHIPQGMGFALLTQVPPVYGLYASFWPTLLYFFFGTSRHNSMGTMALISIMIGNVVYNQADFMGYNEVLAGNDGNSTATNQTVVTEFKVGVAMSITLLMGLVQVIMGICRLGIVGTFMSMTFVNAFMTGAAINIVTSQLPALLQLKLPPRPNMFKTIMTYVDLFKNIKSVNIASMVTGIICLIILFVVKEVINEKYKKRLKVPIPAELMVVVLATIISHFSKFNDRWDVKVVGYIPRGFPTPQVPPMTNSQNYISDAIIIAIISYAITISMAKLMSRKHGYHVSGNQELLASGLTFGIGSFFYSFGGAQAPPRTVVQDRSGGRTQVAGLVSCFLVLLVCLAIGPLFKNLPNTVLAAVIIVALVPLLKSFEEVKNIWKLNKYDFTVWVVTIFCVVIFDITIGLMVGIALNVILVAVQAHVATGNLIYQVGTTGIYINNHKLSEHGGQDSGLRVFRFNSSIYYINAERFKKQLYKSTFNPALGPEYVVSETTVNQETTEAAPNGHINKGFETDCELNDVNIETSQSLDTGPARIHTIIIDMAQVSYIDIMGLNLLQQLSIDFSKHDVKIALAECPENVLKKLAAASMLQEDWTTTYMDAYPTVADAVARISAKGKTGSSEIKENHTALHDEGMDNLIINEQNGKVQGSADDDSNEGNTSPV